jgi:adenine-specific DNA-methyltransferase
VNNTEPHFKKLLKSITSNSSSLSPSSLMLVVDFLNQIKPTEGFIFKNYTPGGTTH